MNGHGLKFYTAIGDHEVGDNPWLPEKAKLVPFFKQAFRDYLKMPLNGPDHMKGTAFYFIHKNTLFISIDVFEKGNGLNGSIVPKVTGKQLEWFENILSSHKSVDHIIVMGHTPVLGPVRRKSSSGLMLKNGRQSPFWKCMTRYNADLYLCGEVHAITCIENLGVLQIAHGGLFGKNPKVSYLLVKVFPNKIKLELKELDIQCSGKKLWQEGNNRPLKFISITDDIKKRGYKSVGKLLIDKSSGKKIMKSKTGYFDESDNPITRLNVKPFKHTPIDFNEKNRFNNKKLKEKIILTIFILIALILLCFLKDPDLKNPLLHQYSKTKTLLLSFSGALLIGLIDYILGPEISFSIFYLLPIFFAAWYGEKNIGLFISAIASLIWFLADQYSGNEYSHMIIPIWNSIVRLGFFLITSLLLTIIKQSLEREENDADTDFLTGLKNSRSFYEEVEKEMKKLKRTKRPLTIVYIDLDNFKKVNDEYGHTEGDHLLTEVAQVLKKNIRETDLSARLGGDEFACLFTDMPKDNAYQVIEKLFKLFKKTIEDNQWIIGISMGAVTFEKPMDNAVDMIKYTDNLMYKVKKQGKNNFIHEFFCE